MKSTNVAFATLTVPPSGKEMCIRDRIKFAQMSEEGFLFWSDYENEVTNKKNPIFPNSSNLRSNVKGGLGVWCGYGVSNYTVNIAEELTKKDSASKER